MRLTSDRRKLIAAFCLAAVFSCCILLGFLYVREYQANQDFSDGMQYWYSTHNLWPAEDSSTYLVDLQERYPERFARIEDREKSKIYQDVAVDYLWLEELSEFSYWWRKSLTSDSHITDCYVAIFYAAINDDADLQELEAYVGDRGAGVALYLECAMLFQGGEHQQMAGLIQQLPPDNENNLWFQALHSASLSKQGLASEAWHTWDAHVLTEVSLMSYSEDLYMNLAYRGLLMSIEAGDSASAIVMAEAIANYFKFFTNVNWEIPMQYCVDYTNENFAP